ncbi:MAG: ATP-binding cassette domain-containing protein [Clostridiales bacterium]|nr:ATP-binding cassette domain-containing protein [Clostridiales bacterium]
MDASESLLGMKRVGRHQFFVSLFSVPMGIVVARLVARAVTLATQGDVRHTCRIALALTFAVIAWRAVEAAAQAALTREKTEVLQAYRMSIYRKLLNLPLSRLYCNERGQSIEGLTNDFNEVAKRDIELIPGLLAGILTVTVYGIFIAYYSPVTAGILLLISLLQILPPVIVKRYMQMNYEDCHEIEAKLDGFFLEAYHGFSTIRLYGRNDWMVGKLKKLHKNYTRIGNRSTVTIHVERSMEILLKNILQYGTYGLIGYLVLLGFTSMEAGIQSIALSSEFFAAVLSVFRAIPEFGTVKVAEKRLASWLESDTGQEMTGRKNGKTEGEAANSQTVISNYCVSGEETERKEKVENTKKDKSKSYEQQSRHEIMLNFDAVSYRYSEQSVPIRDFSERIEPGVTLIRGANGSGKSTLLKLTVGLLLPLSGAITLVLPACVSFRDCASGFSADDSQCLLRDIPSCGDIMYKSKEEESSMRGIAPVHLLPQSFPGDILFLPQEDLSIGISPMQFYEMTEGLSVTEAVKCACSFGLSEELLRDGKIDELSAGQRKKVYLAMAFSMQPVVLLLDEPGNGLDAEGERRLITLLNNRKKARSGERDAVTMVVTHDPALDETADRVILLTDAVLPAEDDVSSGALCEEAEKEGEEMQS